MEVQFILEETTRLTPTVFELELAVQSKADRPETALSRLSAFDSILRKTVLPDFSTWQVRENCWWGKGKRSCRGFEAQADYTFKKDFGAEAGAPLKASEYTSKVLSACTATKSVFCEVRAVRWTVSEEILRKAKARLRFSILQRVKAESKTVAEALSAALCTPVSIDFEPEPVHFPPYRAFKASKAPPSLAPVPQRRAVSLKMRTKVKLDCTL